MKNIVIKLSTIIFVLFFSMCTDKEWELKPGDDSINISAALSRADGDTYSNLYFRAYADPGASRQYIPERRISAVPLYESTASNLIFTDGSPYYPLAQNTIYMYAYTGMLNADNRMQLVSGYSLSNDYLLSNYGERGTTTLTTEGAGTPGSSDDPATVLQFRHVMTRVNVSYEIADPELTSPPENISFVLDSVRARGTYPITALAPVPGNETNALVAANRLGSFEMRLGTNYLVPTGRDLTLDKFTSLIIDDYTATAEDLASFSIENVNGGNPAYLVPGYSYDLIFRINRLRVESITLKLVEWDPIQVENEEITYSPNELQLLLGDYNNSGLDSIVKVVLWADNGREYVGGKNSDNDLIHFVSLPSNARVDSVAFYTSIGLLIQMEPDNYTYSATGSTIELQLSQGGMRLLYPNVDNSEDNPYLLYTPVHILNINKDLLASYRQMVDIDIDRLTYSEQNALSPFETFKGYFDGNGYKINNLIMTGPALIKRNEGIIKNMNITSGRINATGENIAGSICAVNAGTVVASVNEARILGADNIVGGICGLNESTGRVIATVNTGNIENGLTLGGIVGKNENEDQYAVIACINTGLLTKEDSDILGGIIGQSEDSPELVVYNSFWLVGTAAKTFGGPELAVGTGLVGMIDASALSPDKLRDDVDDEATAETLTLLNDALGLTEYASEFVYILDQDITGSVWPIPVKINP